MRPDHQMGEAASTTRRFAAFDRPNFRRYFIGHTISSVGTWTQTLAIIWLVLEITDRSGALGVATALQFLPMLLLGAPAGVLADRIDNRRLLIATSALSALIALALGAVAANGDMNILAIYALTVLLGLVLAVERPAMQAIIYQLVGRDLLPSAVAVNSTINSMSRLIGPALAGALIAGVGVEICFIINAATYLVTIAALATLRTSDLVSRPRITRSTGQLRDGLTYVRAHPDVARPLIVMAVVGTIALNFPTTFPSMVRFGFDLGPGAVGLAMSISAIGSILGGIYIAGIRPHPRRTLAVTLTSFAVANLALAIAPNYWTFVAGSIALGALAALSCAAGVTRSHRRRSGVLLDRLAMRADESPPAHPLDGPAPLPSATRSRAQFGPTQ